MEIFGLKINHLATLIVALAAWSSGIVSSCHHGCSYEL
jgi:hypothetical protein